LRIKTYMYSTMHIYDPTLITEAFLQVPPSVLHSTSFLGGNLQVGGGQTCSSPPAITTPNTWEQTEHGKPKACSCKKKSMLSWAGCWMSLFNPIYTLYLSVYIYIHTSKSLLGKNWNIWWISIWSYPPVKFKMVVV
jgi:hypothetical protein